MKKYDPLADHLARHASGEWRATFSELEAVLGFPLPKLAHTSGAWWANEGLKPHNLAWLDQGWKVGEVDRKGQSVVFKRVPPPQPAQLVALGQAQDAPGAATSAKARLGGAALVGGSVALMAGLGALALRALRRRSV